MPLSPKHSIHDWQTAELRGEVLDFGTEGAREKAFADGFFFVKQPSQLDLGAGDTFAKNFFLDGGSGPLSAYRGFAQLTPDVLAPRQGYHVREEDQVEQFFLESEHWGERFPPALQRQAASMRDFGVAVLRGVLSCLDIPEPLWDRACGGCLSNRGTYHLTFNHFRPEIEKRGLNVHKDSGWVTILRSTEPGLEVLVGDRWCGIEPKPGYFIVNFGCAMEILTRRTRVPVSAVAHRVHRQHKDPARTHNRFSYALFIDNSLDQEVCSGLFRYEPSEGLAFHCSFEEFLTEILANTYNRDTEGLYGE